MVGYLNLTANLNSINMRALRKEIHKSDATNKLLVVSKTRNSVLGNDITAQRETA